MRAHIQVESIEPGRYEVTATQGQVVTRHRMEVHGSFLEGTGIDAVPEKDVVREVCDILGQHEALTAVPADCTLEQLVGRHPYLATELRDRLVAGPHAHREIGPVRMVPRAAEDRPTHT